MSDISAVIVIYNSAVPKARQFITSMLSSSHFQYLFGFLVSFFKLINFIKFNKTNLIKYTTNREARGARDPHPHLGSKFFHFFFAVFGKKFAK